MSKLNRGANFLLFRFLCCQRRVTSGIRRGVPPWAPHFFKNVGRPRSAALRFYDPLLVLLEYRVPEIRAKKQNCYCEHYYEY